MSVNISGLDKVQLLRELWNASKVAAFFTMSGIPPPSWNEALAREQIGSYVDYFQGRVIKSDLSGDMADSFGYDRDNGQGQMQRVVDKLRKSKGSACGVPSSTYGCNGCDCN